MGWEETVGKDKGSTWPDMLGGQLRLSGAATAQKPILDLSGSCAGLGGDDRHELRPLSSFTLLITPEVTSASASGAEI